MTLPTIGEQKTEAMQIRIHIHDKTDEARFDQVYNPPEGWAIDNYQFVETYRAGSTQGPFIVRCAANTNYISSESLSYKKEEFNKVFADLLTKAQGDNNKIESLNSIKAEFESKFDSLSSYSRNFQSSNAGLHVTAIAQCRWKDVLVGKIYTSGGAIEGDINIFLVFIGNQSFLDAYVQNFIEKLKNTLG